MRKVFIVLLSAALLALGVAASSASAIVGGAPEPSESPGCNGLSVARDNHISGPFGASGNPNASAGLGYFIKGQGDGVPFEIELTREFSCQPEIG